MTAASLTTSPHPPHSTSSPFVASISFMLLSSFWGLENRNARFFFGPAVRFVKGVKDSSDLGQLVWQEVALVARGRAGDVHEAVGRWEKGSGFGGNVSINLHNCTRRVKLKMQAYFAGSQYLQMAST